MERESQRKKEGEREGQTKAMRPHRDTEGESNKQNKDHLYEYLFDY